MNPIRLLVPATAAAALLAAAAVACAGDPWLDRVRAFEPGTSSGFGAEQLPGIVLGIPEGLGIDQGSLDVVSLGNDGRIVVSFDDNAVVDGEGDDLVIFENPFYGGSLLFTELAFVEASADGRTWVEFPFDAETGEGLAGRGPVLSSSENGLDPLDPASGGDRFDLADVGLEFVRYLRITDAGSQIDDPGNHSFAGSKGGFDLDAAAAIHSTELGCIDGFVLANTATLQTARIRLTADGEKIRRRRARDHDHGYFRFCRLRPGLDYDVTLRRAGHEDLTLGAYIDEQQIHARVSFSLDEEVDEP